MIQKSNVIPMELWNSKMNEGVFHHNSTKGDKAENIERSIEEYKAALEVVVSDDLVKSMKFRARIILNLGNAYLDRLKGNKIDNIEKAIEKYHVALAVFTKEYTHNDWALAKMNLGAAYGKRIRGDPVENIEKSIVVLQQAREVLSFENRPYDWATTTMNLGAAYLGRFREDRSINIQKAIDFLNQTWKVWNRRKYPLKWAITMINLGTAYLFRTLGNKAGSIELSISAYKQALKELNQSHMPDDWSLTLTNLGNAYLKRVKGDPKRNTELAIEAYEQALSVRTLKDMPIEWAITKMNLGNAYEKAGSIQCAIDNYNQILEVIKYEIMPVDWAITMMNLGTAYFNRVEGSKTENIREAIKAYQNSLLVFHPDSFPNDCRKAARSLGNLYFEKRQWAEATEAYKTAFKAAENLYQASILPFSKEVELSETGDLHRRLAYSLAKSNQLEEAVVFLERGRARILSEALDRSRADIDRIKIYNPELYSEYKKAAELTRNLELRKQEDILALTKGPMASEFLWDKAKEAYANLKETIKRIKCISGYENFLEEPTWESLTESICEGQPLVYLVVTPDKSLALIIYKSGVDLEHQKISIKPVWLEEFTDTFLQELLNKNSEDNRPNGWFATYYQMQDCKDEEFQESQQSWLESFEWVTGELGQRIMKPIISNLQSIGAEEAFLLPAGLLALLPLHAASWEEDHQKHYALDYMAFAYAPSARSIIHARRIREEIETKIFSQLIIQNWMMILILLKK